MTLQNNKILKVLTKLIQHQKQDIKHRLKNIVNQKPNYTRRAQNHIRIEMFFQIKFY